jgi:hypothetical protein
MRTRGFRSRRAADLVPGIESDAPDTLALRTSPSSIECRTMDDHRRDEDQGTPPPPRNGRWANAMYVLIAPFAFAFTGYNLWRLATDGELYIRYEGRFVAADGSLYFWATLLFYSVFFLISGIVLLLFFGWLIGRIRAFARRE